VRKIRIAGRARLTAMGLHGVNIGAVQEVFVSIRIIGLDPVNQFDLSDKSDGLSGARGVRRRFRFYRSAFRFISRALFRHILSAIRS
jgi:hypothetical protein